MMGLGHLITMYFTILFISYYQRCKYNKGYLKQYCNHIEIKTNSLIHLPYLEDQRNIKIYKEKYKFVKINSL